MRPLSPVPALHYVTAPKAHTYRAIIQVFFDAKQHYAIELRPADVLARLKDANLYTELQSSEDPEAELRQLVDWGNLKDAHDTASVGRLEDFYRHRLLYHLTAVGEAAHRAVLDVEATVGKSGSLQTTMLTKIRDALVVLAELASRAEPLPDAVQLALHDLHSGFNTLTIEANRFIGELDRSGADRLAEDRFVLFRDALLAYIGHFVDQLRRLGDEIRTTIEGITGQGFELLLAAGAKSGDLPPALGGANPAEAWVAHERARWSGVRDWFVGNPARGAVPTVERLAVVAVDAVVGLTRTLQRLNERRSRPVDRGADFRALARWFAAAQDDRAAHTIFHAAFGLTSGRHFHLEEFDPELHPPTTSFFDADPVDVPVRLRTRGAVSTQGRPAAAPTHELTRQWIDQKHRRDREQLDAAAQRFVGQGPLFLREIATLDVMQFEVLLLLLDEALSSPKLPDGSRETRSTDGRWIIRLEPPSRGDTALVQVSTPRGRLRCANYRLTVTDSIRQALRSSAIK